VVLWWCTKKETSYMITVAKRVEIKVTLYSNYYEQQGEHKGTVFLFRIIFHIDNLKYEIYENQGINRSGGITYQDWRPAVKGVCGG
jgi:hypothetical protein